MPTSGNPGELASKDLKSRTPQRIVLSGDPRELVFLEVNLKSDILISAYLFKFCHCLVMDQLVTETTPVIPAKF